MARIDAAAGEITNSRIFCLSPAPWASSMLNITHVLDHFGAHRTGAQAGLECGLSLGKSGNSVLNHWTTRRLCWEWRGGGSIDGDGQG